MSVHIERVERTIRTFVLPDVAHPNLSSASGVGQFLSGHRQNELLILLQSALIRCPGETGTLRKERDQTMNLLKVALHFSSVVVLGIRQIGAEDNLARCVSRKGTRHRNSGAAVVCSPIG